MLQGYNPLHLACFGGHITVVGLLLSRSADLLHSADRHGKTGLHIASTHGHYQMVEVLLGQGAEINATDKVNYSSDLVNNVGNLVQEKNKLSFGAKEQLSRSDHCQHSFSQLRHCPYKTRRGTKAYII